MVDLEQQVASLHALVVLDGDARDQARDIGGHLHHLGADMPVARPRRHGVVIPQMLDDNRAHGGDGQRQHDWPERREFEFHDWNHGTTATTPPRTIAYSARLNRERCHTSL
ncbi:hypothetical protein D3C71_1946330 [compost metagenome]